MIWLIAAFLLTAGVFSVPSLREALRRPLNEGMRRYARGDFAELSQGLVHYCWFGPVDGPVIVCVPGISTPAEGFAPMAERLAQQGLRVLTYDHFGRGLSDYVPGPQDQAFFNRQLHELLAHESVVGDITLVGYSVGGVIATGFAAEHPGRLRRLVLIAPNGFHQPKSGLSRFLGGKAGWNELLLRMTFASHARRHILSSLADPLRPETIAEAQRAQMRRQGFFPSNLATLRGILAQSFDEAHRGFAASGLPEVAIWAGNDQLIPPSARERLSALNPNARHEIVAGAGHGIVYTHPEQVAALLSEIVLQPAQRSARPSGVAPGPVDPQNGT